MDGKLVEPFANADRGHYLRVEGEGEAREWVLAEAEGPGYVSRIWSADPAGELRIYVDGAARPALAADFAAIADGQVEPFSAPFGHDASRGRNLYFPFPFAKSIKVTTTKGGQYYQVNVTTLAPGAAVESYSPAVLKRAAGAIAEARRKLVAAPAPSTAPAGFGEGGDTASWEIPEVPGHPPRMITALQCEIEKDGLDEAAVAEILARTLLLIRFDGAAEPQVAVPLGDFFGTGPGLNPFRTAISEVREDGVMLSRWPMPFRKTAKVALHRMGGLGARFRLGVDVVDDPAAGRKLTFHARWLQRDDVATAKSAGTLDWPALRISGGPGRFVGLLCNIYNPTTAWWGEGDEKVYVDGEAFPSTFGTGTEDYFGYAWGDSRPYMSPFHAQTRCDGPGSKGNTSNLRLQVLDSIPFADSLKFDLELWHWEATKVQFATVAYAYAAPGATVEPAGVPDVSARAVHPRPAVTREPGAIEAEALRVRKKTDGEVASQDMAPWGDAWSGYSQLFWTARRPGARLDLELPVAEAGSYALWAAFTRARDYGIVRLAVDGVPLGKPVDLHAPAVVHSGAVPLGVVHLDAGPHVLAIEVVGKAEAAAGHFFGMDWIKLAPAPAGDFDGGRARPLR